MLWGCHDGATPHALDVGVVGQAHHHSHVLIDPVRCKVNAEIRRGGHQTAVPWNVSRHPNHQESGAMCPWNREAPGLYHVRLTWACVWR